MSPNDRSPNRSQPRDGVTDRSRVEWKTRSPVWLRLSGSGLELAFVTIVFGAIGAVVDRQLQSARPVWSAVGGLLGFTLGMVRFIRLATSITNLQREIESAGAGPERIAEDQIAEELRDSDTPES